MGQKYIYPDFSTRKEKAIQTRYGIKFSPEDFFIMDRQGRRKEYFTWAEAMELEKNVLCPNGWRLPTRGEWIKLTEEFQDSRSLMKHTNLRMNGFVSWKDADRYDQTLGLGMVTYAGSCGCYWSSSDSSFPYKYSLYFTDYEVNPVKCSFLSYRYSIRCVAR